MMSRMCTHCHFKASMILGMHKLQNDFQIALDSYYTGYGKLTCLPFLSYEQSNNSGW